MILLNDKKKVFVGQRVDNLEPAWQMPQGGIGQDESPDHAMLRELQEEVGTRHVKIIAKSSKWYQYDLPKELASKLWEGKYKGQKQLWYALRFLGQDNDINIHTSRPEFRAWKWVEAHEVNQLIVPFKRNLYREVLEDLWPFVLEYDS